MKILKIGRIASELKATLPVGTSLLVEDLSIPGFCGRTDGGVEIQNVAFPKSNFSRPALLCRAGGIGDLFFIGFALKKLRLSGLASQVSVYSPTNYAWLYRRFFSMEIGWLPYPSPIEHVRKNFPGVYALEHVMEHSELEKQKSRHITGLFAEAMGVDISSEELPGLIELQAPKIPNLLPSGPRYIGIHPTATSWTRSLTPEKLRAVLNSFLEDGWTPVLYGLVPEELIRFLPAGCVFLSQRHMSFADQVESLRDLTAFVGIDSCFLYLAQAFGVPTVGLYASVLPATRTINPALDRSIMADGACSACYFHHRFGRRSPEGWCKTTLVCGLLQAIAEDRILECVSSAVEARSCAVA